MSEGGLSCRGCGSSNVTFNAKQRLLICNQCGREEFYERATLNANGKVILSRKNAVNFFHDGKYENARHYAMDVLNIAMDNVPALFVMAYYEEFTDMHYGSIKEFFHQVSDVALEYDEVREMMQLVSSCAVRLVDYEEQIIELFARNMQSDESARELNDFIDKICPYFIGKRTSMDYLNENLIEMYKELIGHCGIPRTCLALLKSINSNPDSPYVTHSFYLKEKTRCYYDKYVVPIGEILGCVRNEAYRTKFLDAYNKMRKQYEQEANL